MTQTLAQKYNRMGNKPLPKCMKTITTSVEYSFTEALQKLLDGECLGIKPDENISYLELHKPYWMNEESPDYLLRWAGNDKEFGIRTNMYFERWKLVILDHRTIIKADFIDIFEDQAKSQNNFK